MRRESIAYLDPSAIVKLVIQEPESEALRRDLARHPVRASSALARVEVVRAVKAHGAPAMRFARQVLDRIHLVRLDDTLLDAAANLGPPDLRSLDAIHLAAALDFGQALEAIVTYDTRMSRAAEALGLPVSAPT